MKDRTINVNITKTLQEKQFEPIRISVSLGGNLAPGEDFDEETSEARELCRAQVLLELNEWLT